MLTNVSDIQNEVLVRGNRTTMDSFVTDTILNTWMQQAYTWASNYKKWPYSEGRISTTFASLVTDPEYGWLVGNYPEGWKPDSIRKLTIGGKLLDKKNFYKFQKYIEDNPQTNKRIYTDYGNVLYINQGIDVSGTVTFWGQYTPVVDTTDKTATTVFSYNDEDGNDAIVEKMLSYLRLREHSPNEAGVHDQRATAKLDALWQKIQDEQYGYQTTDDEGQWKRMDVLGGALRDDLFKRDQFY